MDDARQSPEERIRAFQKKFWSSVLTIGFLFVINLMTSLRFPWFIFPALAFSVGLGKRLVGMLIDGIPFARVLQRQPIASAAAPRAPGASSAVGSPSSQPDTRGVSAAVLDGPVGRTVREAKEARAEIRDVLARLPEAERQLLPKEVLPTVDALAERIFSLGASLHQLETDASVFAIEKLEHRIADARATTDGSSARARLLELLERQLVTVRALAATRDTVRGQLESASTVLETMRLDLLTLRSSGLDTRMASSAEATQQARALSRDIARAIEAADEVRRI
jgi:hypothetical protein